MIEAGNVVRGVRTAVLLLMALSLAACGGSSTTESDGSGPYTVGGTVTGITSGGTLSISNRVNNQLDHQKNRMILRANTTYIFSRTVSSGGSYQVAVEGDPINQRCTVTNGSGLASGNVSNVNIHCVTPPKYSVGGSVTGLSGSLTLRVNGGDDVILSANSSYTFPSALMSGTAYQVSVYNEPANQDCTVSNASGTLNSNVTDVTVHCVSDSWDHPANLGDNISLDGFDAINPQVAMDGNGNAIAVWQQFDGTHTQIYMSDYNLTAANAWTPATSGVRISVAGSHAVNPQVAMGRNGANDDAVIVWSQKDGGGVNSQLFMSERRAGAWSHPASLASFINPGTTFIFDDPQVAMDGIGNTIIVWRQHNGAVSLDSPQLYVSEYRSGAWTHPALAAPFTFLTGQPVRPVRFTPAVAMSDNGEAVVVWRQHSGTSGGAFLIQRREYRAGSWSAVPDPFHLNGTFTPFRSGNISSPKVAMDNIGNTIIVWDQAVAEAQPHPYFPGADPVDITHVFKSEYRSGSWTDPVNQTDNISVSGLQVQNPNVVMNNNGEAIITWQQEDASRKQRIFKSEYRANAWTHPASLSDNMSIGGAGVSNHDVAMANNGDAIVTWRQFDGFKYAVYKSEYRVSVAEWRHPVGVADAISSAISTPTDCDEKTANCEPAPVSIGPVVAMDNSAAPGDAVILWSQSDAEPTALPATVPQQIFKSELR